MTLKRILVMLVALMVLTLLFSSISCAPSTPPPPVKETVLVTVVPSQPTAVPAAPTGAPAPTATAAPKPPEAVLQIVNVPANAALPGAITATIQMITDTAVGPSKTTVALGTTGLSNVPINVPIRLSVSAADPKNTG
jgi:hypothetical protein